jgi:hypothetical protein
VNERDRRQWCRRFRGVRINDNDRGGERVRLSSTGMQVRENLKMAEQVSSTPGAAAAGKYLMT